MFSFLKKVAKTTLLTGLVVGGTAAAAVAVLGNHRARALAHQVHDNVVSRIDQAIQDPALLRSMIQELEEQYPHRITQVRGDLSELDSEIAKLQRDQAISKRVVELADTDLQVLDTQLTGLRGDTGSVQLTSTIEFSGGLLTYDRAVARRSQIQGTRQTYTERSLDADFSLKYLSEQRERLVDLLTRLETERAELRTKTASLSRQIDAIERNDRLIDQLKRYEETFDRCDRYETHGLEDVTSRLSAIRSRQEAELDVLSKSESHETSYEDLARMQISEESVQGAAASSEGVSLSAPNGFTVLLPAGR